MKALPRGQWNDHRYRLHSARLHSKAAVTVSRYSTASVSYVRCGFSLQIKISLHLTMLTDSVNYRPVKISTFRINKQRWHQGKNEQTQRDRRVNATTRQGTNNKNIQKQGTNQWTSNVNVSLWRISCESKGGRPGLEGKRIGRGEKKWALIFSKHNYGVRVICNLIELVLFYTLQPLQTCLTESAWNFSGVSKRWTVLERLAYDFDLLCLQKTTTRPERPLELNDFLVVKKHAGREMTIIIRKGLQIQFPQ